MLQYKGKGEHSVQGLEHIIECQKEELHQLKSKQNKVILNRLREQYKSFCKIKKVTEINKTDIRVYNSAKNYYNAMRLFCLDCELVTFNDIEVMEYEVNNEVNSSF